MILSVCLIQSTGLFAQKKAQLQAKADIVLSTYYEEWQLNKADISDYIISSHHTTEHNQVTHVYLNQSIDGIPIHNAIANFSYKNKQTFIANSRFVKDARSKVVSTAAALSATAAVHAFAKHHDLEAPKKLKSINTESDGRTLFTSSGLSDLSISAEKKYYVTADEKLILAWKIEALVTGTTDYWSSFVSAADGSHLASKNLTTSCRFHKHSYTNQDRLCREQAAPKPATQPISPDPIKKKKVQDGSSYLVYPLPLESPAEGNQVLVTEPALEIASPFGWHDTDGVDGPEHTITRGNNVHAFNNATGNGRTEESEPDGGVALSFNFPRSRTAEPFDNVESDVTQLFYLNNWMHDFSYFFGFDEAAGNFQVNNYGKPGRGDDEVEARTLEDFDNGDDQEFNNARFASPSDGSNGVMFMFPWTSLEVNLKFLEPAEDVVPLPFAIGNFGFDEAGEFTSSLVFAMDAGGVSVTDACDSITNAADIAGKIVLVDRGECDFSFKVFQLQKAGAVGVIVGNNQGEQLVSMAAGQNSDDVTIPSAFISQSQRDYLLSLLNQGKEVIFEFDVDIPTPRVISGSYDNGVVNHEYGHGISIRMTGGRSQSGCLNADEQMGEGWSDFLTLVTTAKADDLGTDTRGLGTFIDRSNPSMSGIRRLPYSTDKTVNNQTYHDIRFTGFTTNEGRRGEHEVGEVWNSMLWDMYWAFVEQDGFDPDWTNRESGNYKAIQLVFDGMAMQRCNPGFVDGRNAILAADQASFDGANQCLIWKAFAERGLGFDADQGSAFQREDGVEGYLTHPSCRNELSITKQATEIINAGDLIEVTLTIANYTGQTVTGVTVSDVIPENTQAGLTDVTVGFDYSPGDDMVSFDIGSMANQELVEISYFIQSDVDLVSFSYLLDGADPDLSILTPTSIAGEIFWENKISEVDQAWVIEGKNEVYDQALTTTEPVLIAGESPVLRLSHNYDTHLFFSGADIEVSTNGGSDWTSITEDQFLLNAYNDRVGFKANRAKGFTGESDELIESIIDLSAYRGQSIDLRFRYTSLIGEAVSSAATPGLGWLIESIEFSDQKSYDLNQACVSSEEGFSACDGAMTYINADLMSSTNEILQEEHSFSLYPNPASDQLNLTMNPKGATSGIMNVYSLDGSLLVSEALRLRGSAFSQSFDISRLQTGFYLVSVSTPEYSITQKLMVGR